MLHFAFAFCWWICVSLDSYFRCCSEWFGAQKQCVTCISKCWFISRSCGMCLRCTMPLWSKKSISITFSCCTPSMLLSFAKRIFVVMMLTFGVNQTMILDSRAMLGSCMKLTNCNRWNFWKKICGNILVETWSHIGDNEDCKSVNMEGWVYINVGNISHGTRIVAFVSCMISVVLVMLLMFDAASANCTWAWNFCVLLCKKNGHSCVWKLFFFNGN